MADTASIGLRANPRRRSNRLDGLRRSRMLRELARNRAAMAALAVIVLIAAASIVSLWYTPADPNAQSLSDRLQGPSLDHWLGTDSFGRDQLSRLMVSGRLSLQAVTTAVALALAVGVPLGLLAGVAPGWVDGLLSRVADALLTLPAIVLALAIVGVLGSGLSNAMIAVGIVLSPSMFRIGRAAARSVSRELYIEACRSVGCSPWRLMWRHVLPNASSPLLIEATFSAGVVIIAEASLSFLGLGAQPPQASWGSMLREAFRHVHESPWFMLPPSALIVITILVFSVLGDGLSDALEGRGGRR